MAVAAASLATLVAAPSPAGSFSLNYCERWVPEYTNSPWRPEEICKVGNYHSITYNSARSLDVQGGQCVYAITQADRVRGGRNGVVCEKNGRFVNECFYPETPMSEGRLFALDEGKTIRGHIDNSPNHTNCL